MGDSSAMSFPFGLEPHFWERLHSRVSPNTLTVECFANAVMNGTLGDHFLVIHIRRFAQAFRDAMLERGDWAEMEHVRVTGRKNEMVEGMRRAVMQLCRSSSSPAADTRTSSSSNTATPSSVLGPPPAVAGLPLSNSTNVAAPPTTITHTNTNTPTPATPGLRLGQLLPPHLSTIPLPTLQATPPFPSTGAVASPLGLLTPSHVRERWSGGVVGSDTSRTPAAFQGVEGNNSHGVHGLGLVVPSSSTPASSSSLPIKLVGGKTTGTAGGVLADVQRALVLSLNGRVSPFYQVLHVMKTVALRYGSTPIKFQIPVHFAAGVQSRRLRVHILPYTPTPNPSSSTSSSDIALLHPHKWPSVKDLVIYINDQGIQTPWKRTWPERAVEVAKTYLPLDITQYLSVSSGAPHQRAQIDIFNKEYTTHAAFAVVETFTVEQVVERILLREFGASSLDRVVRSSECAPRVEGNRRAAFDLYHTIMDDDDDDGLVVADDPVITTYCPLTRGEIQIPVRGRHCVHVQCVDLTNYLLHGQRGGYWNCVVCDAELRVEDIRVDIILWEYLHQHRSPPPPPPPPHGDDDSEDTGEVLQRDNGSKEGRLPPATSSRRDSQHAGGVCLPLRLQLSRVDPTSPSNPSQQQRQQQGSGVTPYCYYWHPARDGTSEEEVIVSDSDDTKCSSSSSSSTSSANAQREEGNHNSLQQDDPQRQERLGMEMVRREAYERSAWESPNHQGLLGRPLALVRTTTATATVGTKRGREEQEGDGPDPSVAAEEGTAENPIEL